MTVKFTDEELAEFDEFTQDLSSINQMVRISARTTGHQKIVEKFGKEKCDAMFAELLRRDEAKAKRRSRR